ncbi:MAG: DNA cytosine methyltransferase [Betaproteobacteria bacterium]|nr:DNA cytosine methyltransferase [Betaproteobacteria bacterium]
MNELALFAGAGGGILAGHLLGWRTVCAVEWEPYAACVLAARQNDGILPPFPIWDDIQTFDGRPWRGIVDVVSGGFPCQDISAAGRGDGLEGERSGLWREMARVVGEVRPRYVFVENSPMLTARGGARVIADLTALRYDAQWDIMGAADVGAPHQRDRIWIVAENISNAYSLRCNRSRAKRPSQRPKGWECKQFEGLLEQAIQTGIPAGKHRRIHDGVAARVDRLKAIGNGQVPRVAATAFNLLATATCRVDER